VLVLFQFFLGGANILLKTPVSIQLLHLLCADLLWIAWVLLAFERKTGRSLCHTTVE